MKPKYFHLIIAVSLLAGGVTSTYGDDAIARQLETMGLKEISGVNFGTPTETIPRVLFVDRSGHLRLATDWDEVVNESFRVPPDALRLLRAETDKSAIGALPVEDGYIVATNGGEFGGAVWFIDKKSSGIRNVCQSNFRGLSSYEGRILGVQGDCHGEERYFDRRLVTVERVPSRKFECRTLVDLPFCPTGVLTVRGKLFISSQDAFYIVDRELLPQKVAALPTGFKTIYATTYKDNIILTGHAGYAVIMDPGGQNIIKSFRR
jgi:hypothetical protein